MPMPSDAIPAPPSPTRPRFIDPNIFRDIRTYIALTGLIIGIIGLYHYYESVQVRIPAYYVSPTRARIVDTSIPAPPQLQVLYKGKDLNANVSAATVYLWNDGKLPIRADDVLEPVTIELDPTCTILETRVLKVSRAVTKFAKGEVSETAKNWLPLSFSILEHNDGAVIQIIYSGNPDTTVSLNGTILSAGSPLRLASDVPEAEELANMRKTMVIVSVILCRRFANTQDLLKRCG